MAKKKKKTPDEIREGITSKMVDALSEGTPPWRQPWSSSPNAGHPCNFASGRRYTGINPLILMLASMTNGYGSRHWGTYDSWTKETGGHVTKGEHGTQIAFYRMFPKKDEHGKPEFTEGGKPKMIPYFTVWSLFNVEQVQAPTVESLLKMGKEDLLALAEKQLKKAAQPKPSLTKPVIAKAIHEGVEAKLKKYHAEVGEVRNRDPDFKPAEELIVATGAVISYDGSKACYSPSGDKITMPPKGRFDNVSHFYETAFHELTHWSESPKRVGKRERKDKGGDKYAFGELVAEIGACFLCAELQIPLADQMIQHSRGYVKHWLGKMQSDPKFIFDASSQASKTSDYLLSFVGRENIEVEEKPKAKRKARKPRARKVA